MTQFRQPIYGQQPTLAYSLQKEFNDSPNATEHSNFLKGVKWSPDGLGFAAAADDNWLRVYDTPIPLLQEAAAAAPLANEEDSITPAVNIHAGELVYDFCWYSQAAAAEPSSWCLATTSRSHPIHLWDALTGELRCSYRCYDAVDELTAAFSVAFDPEGSKIYGGHRASIYIFDIERPGRDYNHVHTKQQGMEGQTGIISCIAFTPDSSGLMAAGSYAGSAALYDSRTMESLFVLEGHTGGVTHLEFSADGNYLYTGARQDGAIHCWDARNASGVVYTIERCTRTTNQRIYFDIEPLGRHLATGGEDGYVAFHDLRDGSKVGDVRAARDTVNGVDYHPHLPLLATSSGQRRFADMSDSDSEGSGGGPADGITSDENVLRLWQLASEVIEIPDAVAFEDGGDELLAAAADQG